MRGERFCRTANVSRQSGSSPHARGTHGDDGDLERLPRFIPACAGNAHHRSRHPRPSSVHPRIRGERPTGKRSMRRPRGSSPHARGTPCAAALPYRLVRFIPACAGNAASALHPSWPASVHPRMRGERPQLMTQWPPLFGSSPHARGTLFGCRGQCPEPRFIPACAGNAG